ncbi:hypothetical protein [Saccharopolyspora gregorii]|uniref:GNAT family N-acetyltransferase n=1 Tax=Saccharopolyspora gregorii TaxID=33914 RepID=A0ABP6S304_9PSEU
MDPDTQVAPGEGADGSRAAPPARGGRCAEVLLYVEGDNAPAIKVYQRLGFERTDLDVQFGR